MVREWALVSRDGWIMERGSRKHVEAALDRYERECRERGDVPAVTYIRRALTAGPGAAGPRWPPAGDQRP